MASSIETASMTKCAKCRKVTANPTILPCNDKYCPGCINDLDGADSGAPICLVCKTGFSFLDPPEPGCIPCEREHSKYFRNNYWPEASPAHGEAMSEISNADLPRYAIYVYKINLLYFTK